MAEHGAVAARHDGRAEAGSQRQRLVPDGVDAAVDAKQPPAADADVDPRTVQPHRHELAQAEDAVLSRGEPSDAQIRGVPGLSS